MHTEKNMNRPFQPPLENRGALSVEDFCGWAGISRSRLYREVAEGNIKLRKIGRKSVVTMTDAQAWLAALPVVGSKEAA